MRERVRARFFPKWPGAVLFFIPDGLRLTVRDLVAPFGRKELRQSCHEEVQISEADAGRWTRAILSARAAAKAERAQRHQLQEATEACLLLQSVDPRERDRATVVLQKQTVDARSREIKIEIAQAKTDAATRGVYMEPRRFRALETELETNKQQSQALQTQLGQIRLAEKADNIAKSATRDRAFVKAAYELLDSEVYDAVMDRAEEIFARLEV